MTKDNKLQVASSIITYITYALSILFIMLISHIIYSNFKLWFDRVDLSWNEHLLSLTWDVLVSTWDVEGIVSSIDEIISKSRNSKEDVLNLVNSYIAIWELWKAMLVAENYLSLWEWDYYDNVELHHSLALLYENFCTEENINFCYSSIKHFLILQNLWLWDDYLLNMANVAWRIWDEDIANSILDIYYNLEGDDNVYEEIEIDPSMFNIEYSDVEFIEE